MPDRAGKKEPVLEAVIREVERFFYREARLLDERRFNEWLDLFTDDARYWMPVRMDKSSKAPGEFSAPGQLAFFDETKETLDMRVKKLATGMAWAEEPPSRTRHLITNVEIDPGDTESEFKALSNFVLYRTRLENKQDLLVGRREDLLRRENGALKIAQREIFLDQTVVTADNLSIFF